jgi:hypothetical protein
MNTGNTAASDEALEWFLTGFSARDLAEPLLSVDANSPRETANAIFRTSRAEVIGIRVDGFLRGWIGQELLPGETINSFNELDAVTLVADSASLNEVVCALNTQPRLFVQAFGQVSGIITRNAVEKPPVRMWLFGLVTISEQRVTQLIAELLPNDAWKTHLSAGRLQKAQELQHLRNNRGQRPSLLDCLQFADKGQIVARDESLRLRTRFASRKEVELFVQALQDLRNNLAHSQDIGGDWEVIHDLAANLHHIVCGLVKKQK